MNDWMIRSQPCTTMKQRKINDKPKEEYSPVTEEEKHILLSAYSRGIKISSDPKLQHIARKIVNQPPKEPEISLRRKLDFIVILVMVVIIAIVFRYYIDKSLPSLSDLLKPNT